MRRPIGVVVATGPRNGHLWPLCDTPRALVPLAGRALVAHQIDAVRRAGASRVVVVSPPQLVEPLKAAVGDAANVEYVVGKDPPCVVDALLAARAGPDDVLIVQPAGHLLGAPLDGLVASLEEHALDALLVDGNDAPEPQAAVEHGGDLLVLSPRAYAALRAAPATRQEGGVETVVELVARDGGQTAKRSVPGYLACRIQTGDDLLRANRLLLRGIEPDVRNARTIDSRIEGEVAIDAEALVESSVISGPAAIGAGARVYDCYIGPYTSIGYGASLEYLEIENSIVLPGALVEGSSHRLRESIIGRNARVIGTSGLRGLRLRIGADAEVSLP